jgi:hypothetical protein
MIHFVLVVVNSHTHSRLEPKLTQTVADRRQLPVGSLSVGEAGVHAKAPQLHPSDSIHRKSSFRVLEGMAIKRLRLHECIIVNAMQSIHDEGADGSKGWRWTIF